MPFPCQVSRSRLAALRHRPEAPDFLAGRLIECRQESPHALVAAGRAGDDEVADRQGSAGRVVVLAPVGHLGVPAQRAGHPVERDDVRVIRHHEDLVAGDRHAAIGAAGGVADEAFRARPLIPPDLPARARVERVALVRARHVHHAARDDRRDLQRRGVRQAEDPLRREPRGVAFRDVRERAVAAAARLAVVARPVRLRRHLAVRVAVPAKQVQHLVVAEQLHVVRAAVEDESLEQYGRRRASPSRARAPMPARGAACAGSAPRPPIPAR